MSAGAGSIISAKLGANTQWGAKLGAVGRILARTVVGGTISKVTGGKFANGAVTAAFASIVAEGTREYYKNNPYPNESYTDFMYRTRGVEVVAQEWTNTGTACDAGCPGGTWEIDLTSGWATGGYFGGGVTLSRQTLSCTTNTCSCQLKVACYGGGPGAVAGIGIEGGKVKNAPDISDLNGNSKVLTITGGPVSVNIPLSENANASWGAFKSTGAGVFYQNCSSTVVSCEEGSSNDN